ncbi:hypothetical protein TNCV_5073151 [Trichonephila clavipes]|nr:hypothetical protein TNCV_5073151 [Trichonephila clavipes]
MALYRSPLTVTLWLSSFLKKYEPMIPPAHKAHQTGQVVLNNHELLEPHAAGKGFSNWSEYASDARMHLPVLKWPKFQFLDDKVVIISR